MVILKWACAALMAQGPVFVHLSEPRPFLNAATCEAFAVVSKPAMAEFVRHVLKLDGGHVVEVAWTCAPKEEDA